MIETDFLMHLVGSNSSLLVLRDITQNLVFRPVLDHQNFLLPIEANGAVVMC